MIEAAMEIITRFLSAMALLAVAAWWLMLLVGIVHNDWLHVVVPLGYGTSTILVAFPIAIFVLVKTLIKVLIDEMP